MKILVACEFSGTVRDAFCAAGHDAVSCDIFASETPGAHIIGDVLGVLGNGWDMMVAHPPCTHLATSGALHFHAKTLLQQQAIWFFSALAHAPIPLIAIENPVSIMSSVWRKPDQVIQPWMFGHPEQKATCLWLKGLPALRPTNNVHDEMMAGEKKDRMRNAWIPPGRNRAKERARFYPGVAEAMAAQWARPFSLSAV